MFKLFHPLEGTIIIPHTVIRPAFWFRDMTMYLVLSALTSSPISLVAATTVSAFSFRVCMLPPSILACVQYRDIKSCWSSGKEVFKTVQFQSKFLFALR